ncbi:sigma-70 family RNA polymerase sigma factor [Nocardioides nitrophenolicus]|uniref:sigma-70 family RNA polymerase sigma factor n=1 Tax=Nocardioides nitrophenolicus TaxID=60489 RepID=UPI00195D91E3|nr:sigma-70 family RNA polymerase sigma factor [Nocardioides nitrophenolicus]MBM7518457.1 RNA polymerase sigma factor (sigma-70 family) [Nocardioides nitrophenolicus]
MTVSGPPADDATLVAGVLAGDRHAFAGVYERYADRLHDFAYSLLRNREEAADCVADSFVVLAEKVGQLRDRSRLRPWLYSVVRNECLRTLRGRAREAHDDEWLAAMPDLGGGPEQQVTDAAVQDELRELVWAAVEGLNDRDRALLDLHLRQGLEGAELAAAMDVTPQSSYVMLSRARDQVERALGALLVARRGSELCADLSGILDGWDGRFSPLIRKRVSRHIDGCEACETRRRLMVSPLALLAGVPAFAAPAALRDRVLEDERLVAHYIDDPVLPPPGDAGHQSTPRRPLLVVGLVLLLLALGGAAALTWWPEDTAPAVATDPATTATAPSPTTVATSAPTPSEPAPTTAAEPSPPTTPTAPTAPTAATEPTSTGATVAAPGELQVSTRTLRLGARSGGSVRLSNTGGTALSYAVRSRVAWLSVSRTSGSLEPGADSGLTVTVDRSTLAEGSSTGAVAVSWSGGTVLVSVQAAVDRPPVIGALQIGGPTDCTGRTVTATASDTTLRSVRVAWSGPSGNGQQAMSASGGGWTASIGPFPIGGSVTATVTAVDRAGHTSTRSTSFDVDPCPG